MSGFSFRRQHPIGPFVADFYCAKLKLIIEMDGDQHATRIAHDQRRTEYLSAKGLKVVRFWNRELFGNIRGFEENLLLLIRDRARELGIDQPARWIDPLLTSPFQGEGHSPGASFVEAEPGAKGDAQ